MLGARADTGKFVARPLRERFFEQVNFNGPIMPGMATPCHEWTGARYRHYGKLTYGCVFLWKEPEFAEYPPFICRSRLLSAFVPSKR